MRRFLLPLLAALALPTAVNAEVDSKVHKLCLPAADYLGCVKAMNTKSSDIPSLRLIEGAKELTGNKCAEGFVYAGAGDCRQVISYFTARGTPVGFALIAGGYEEVCSIFGCEALTLSSYSQKAVLDPSCPNKEPFLYTNSSCDDRLKPLPMKRLKKYLRFHGVKKQNIPRWDKQLYRIFGVEGLATKAKNYKKPPSNPNASTGSVKINCDSPVWKNKPKCN